MCQISETPKIIQGTTHVPQGTAQPADASCNVNDLRIWTHAYSRSAIPVEARLQALLRWREEGQATSSTTGHNADLCHWVILWHESTNECVSSLHKESSAFSSGQDQCDARCRHSPLLSRLRAATTCSLIKASMLLCLEHTGYHVQAKTSVCAELLAPPDRHDAL